MSPYQPLDVIQTGNKVDGTVWFVRDEEFSHLWNRVEYVGSPGRLTCWCDDGEAHAESPDTENPCSHLSQVVDHRMAELRSKGKPLGVLIPSTFVD